ncbi:MAG: 30S ribosomal protein S1 [Candidatus Latescibacterota bacterium]|nr:MAG: 30S ribosomal protein S1 [Candidatus Latescibacterota bacterium]
MPEEREIQEAPPQIEGGQEGSDRKGGDVLEEGYSQEELAQLYEQTLQKVEEGQVVMGKVLRVDRDGVIVDIGFKSEGVIPIEEFNTPVEVGMEVPVFVESLEDQEGQPVLSKKKADFMLVWDRIWEAYEKGEVVEGTLVRRIKGGIVVDLFGVEAFLPGSQIDIRRVRNFDQFIGQVFPLKIIKVNKARRNIVVSRRAVLEEERERQRQKLLAELEEGQVRKGIVKNITDFGVFIDLGGMDGLLHITDMSWKRIEHPSELVSVGQEIEVKVLRFDRERNRISLGLKQLQPHPWEKVAEKYPVGERVKGRVVSLTDYGAFVELEEGIEGLIHISEMSWTQHVRHPSQVLSEGQEVEAVVLSVNPEEQKISLGLKQLHPDPWEDLEERYPVGTRIKGVVRNITSFGAFVEVEEGIDGLVHISDMSWTKRIQHPSEVMKKGDVVEVVVLDIDKERRRISLGYKQAQEDPWDHLVEEFPPGKEVQGKAIRVLDKGVVVELPGEVEGFVPASQLAFPEERRPEDVSVGDVLNLRVIEFDREQRRIVLKELEEFPPEAEPSAERAEEPPTEEAPAEEETPPEESPAEGETPREE